VLAHAAFGGLAPLAKFRTAFILRERRESSTRNF
jgi:hypothetical protein